MTTTNNPENVRTADASYAHGVAMDAPRTRVTSRRGDETTRVTSRRGDETKAFYKTTEFIVFIVATMGFCLPRTWFRRPTGAATTSRPIRHGCTS